MQREQRDSFIKSNKLSVISYCNVPIIAEYGRRVDTLMICNTINQIQQKMCFLLITPCFSIKKDEVPWDRKNDVTYHRTEIVGRVIGRHFSRPLHDQFINFPIIRPSHDHILIRPTERPILHFYDIMINTRPPHNHICHATNHIPITSKEQVSTVA